MYQEVFPLRDRGFPLHECLGNFFRTFCEQKVLRWRTPSGRLRSNRFLRGEAGQIAVIAVFTFFTHRRSPVPKASNGGSRSGYP